MSDSTVDQPIAFDEAAHTTLKSSKRLANNLSADPHARWIALPSSVSARRPLFTVTGFDKSADRSSKTTAGAVSTLAHLRLHLVQQILLPHDPLLLRIAFAFSFQAALLILERTGKLLRFFNCSEGAAWRIVSV